MSDTKALITVARSLLARPKDFCGRDVMADLVAALEQAEAQLAAALQANAARQAEVTADVLNVMMAGITGQKESVRVEVEGFQCPYCNEISKTIEAATAHDAICPKHPAVIRAEKAEAEVARQIMVSKALARKLVQATRTWGKAGNMDNSAGYWLAWAEHDADSEIKAARRAVAKKGE